MAIHVVEKIQLREISLTIFSADVAVVVASKVFAASTNPLQTWSVLMVSFDINDFITDLWRTTQAFDVIPFLGYAAAFHLMLVVAFNCFLIDRFVKEIQDKEKDWYMEATQNGRSFAWKAIIVMGFFGPKVLNLFGTNLFGMKLFSLSLDRMTKHFIHFNWGSIAESVPQTVFAVLQNILASRKLNPIQQRTMYLSLVLSVFNILICAVELMFGKSDEDDERGVGQLRSLGWPVRRGTDEDEEAIADESEAGLMESQ